MRKEERCLCALPCASAEFTALYDMLLQVSFASRRRCGSVRSCRPCVRWRSPKIPCDVQGKPCSLEAFRAIRALRHSTSSSSSRQACSKRWTASRSISCSRHSSLHGGSQGSPQEHRAHSSSRTSHRCSIGHSRAPCPCSSSSRGSRSSCLGCHPCSSHSRHGSRRRCRSRLLWRLRSRACRAPSMVSSSMASNCRHSSSWGSKRLIWPPPIRAAQGSSKPGSSGPLCSCPSRSPCPGPLGNWQHPLGQSLWRDLDKHNSSTALVLSRCSIS